MKYFILSYIIITTSIYSQNLDSLYKKLLSLKGKQKSEFSIQSLESKTPDKCGFGINSDIKTNYDKFDLNQQQTIDELLSRPTLQTSIVSPSGIFRIHFDESGINKPEYDIEELAVAFDSSYNYEINILGYLPPPTDENLGGDDKYDVYVFNLGGGLYGATTPEVYIEDGKYISYIEMDNSFGKNEGFNSYGINAARVTAAHEFHHAIQVGRYLYKSEDLYYHELTSTSMEEFVYDEVNDYYAYMPSFFNNTDEKFENHTGYDLAIWNIFLREKMSGGIPSVGDKIIKRSWEIMRDNDSRAIIALANALQENDYSFTSIFNEFGDWLYFTGERSKENDFFEEGREYPLVRRTMTNEFTGSEKTVMLNSKPTSINYLEFTDYSQGLPDTIVAVLSNSDIFGSTNSGPSINIDFTLSNYSIQGSNSINDFYYSLIEGEFKDYIYDSYVINNELSSNAKNSAEIDYAYPQPFDYFSHSILLIPTHPDISAKALLYIYSSDMNLVYNSEKNISLNDNIVVKWDGLDNNGVKLSSGVYLYVTKADGKIKKGKIVILNK